jgi:hypothetical protein
MSAVSTVRHKSVHFVLSVDVDRFPDRKLTREFLTMFARLGAQNARDIRRLCADYRARGFEVFPACDNHDARGFCIGHDAPDCSPHPSHPHRCAAHELRLLGTNGRCSR